MDGFSDSGVAKTTQEALRFDVCKADPRRFGEGIAFDDHRIKFFVAHATSKDVLDIGCIDHDPDSTRSRYWVHRALRSVSKSVVGIDLYEQGIRTVRAQGYNVYVADAQIFDLGALFDVIVAGDVITHLEDIHGFLESCKRHLKPGGKVLITTPNPWNWRLLLRSAVSRKTCGNPEQTLWICPQTLRQVALRHGMNVTDVRYSSGQLIDKIMPLPPGWKHSTIQAVLTACD